jgi:hypothetical protein
MGKAAGQQREPNSAPQVTGLDAPILDAHLPVMAVHST